MLDVMRASELRYLEGSKLIISGDSIGARLAFNEAVDLILQSEWDLASTPVLGSYFQDLIHKIQRDESRYLRPEDSAEVKPEPAVLDELNKLDLIPIQVDPVFRDAVEADILNTQLRHSCRLQRERGQVDEFLAQPWAQVFCRWPDPIRKVS